MSAIFSFRQPQIYPPTSLFVKQLDLKKIRQSQASMQTFINEADVVTLYRNSW